jgi:hypothetical protein
MEVPIAHSHGAVSKYSIGFGFAFSTRSLSSADYYLMGWMRIWVKSRVESSRTWEICPRQTLFGF